MKKSLTRGISALALSTMLLSNVNYALSAGPSVQLNSTNKLNLDQKDDPRKPGIFVKNNSGGTTGVTPENMETVKQQAVNSLKAAAIRDQNEKLASKDAARVDDPNQHKPDEIVKVIVQLEGATASELSSSSDQIGVNQLALGDALSDLHNDIEAAQNEIRNGLTPEIMGMDANNGQEVVFKHEYLNIIKGFSVENIKYSEIPVIESIPGVKAVTLQRTFEPAVTHDHVEHDLTGIKDLWSGDAAGSKYKGEGMVVAIVDTGVDWKHETFPDPTNMALAKYPTGKYSKKVVEGYNWADQTDDVIPDIVHFPGASSHGVHVAGIAAGSGPYMLGVAPEAQIIAEKVFSNQNPGALEEDIIKGIDHASAMGADVINMSLGSSSSFDHRDPNDPLGIAIRNATDAGHIVVVAAGNASNAYDDKGDLKGRINLAETPDLNKIGNPGVYPDSFTVAAANINIQKIRYGFTVRGADGIVYGEGLDAWPDRADHTRNYPLMSFGLKVIDNGWFEPPTYIDDKYGLPEDYKGNDVIGKVVLMQRGVISFAEKVANAKAHGAIGVIVYNSGPDDVKAPPFPQGFGSIPFAFINAEDGFKLQLALAADTPPCTSTGLGNGYCYPWGPAPENMNNMTVDAGIQSSPFTESGPGQPTDFSSWGTTSDLLVKPQIMAPGLNIVSSITSKEGQPDPYESESGTSMAAPYVAGALADVMQALKDRPYFETSSKRNFVQTVKNIVTNTAIPAIRTYEDAAHQIEYQPRRQGAGMIRPDLALQTPVVVAGSDGTGIASLKEIGKTKTFTLTATNFTANAVSYDLHGTAMIDELRNDTKTYSDNIRSKKLASNSLTLSKDSFTVPANSTASFDVTLTVSDEVKPNSFVEGYVYLEPQDSQYPTLNVPYNGFYGQWDQPTIIDPSDTGMWSQSEWGTQMGRVFAGNPISYAPINKEEEDLKATLKDKYYAFAFSRYYPMYPVPFLGLLRGARSINIDIVDEHKTIVTHLKDLDWQVKADPYSSGIAGTYNPDMVWTGTNLGIAVPDGQYYYAISATADSPNAEKQAPVYLPVYKDSHAPQVEISKSPQYNEASMPETTITSSYTLSWTVNDDANPPQQESGGVLGGDTFIALNGTELYYIQDENGKYVNYQQLIEKSGNSYKLTVRGLNSGFNLFTVQPRDRAGNIGESKELVVKSATGLFIDESSVIFNNNIPSLYWSANVKPDDTFTFKFDVYGKDLNKVQPVIVTSSDENTAIASLPVITKLTPNAWVEEPFGDQTKYTITGTATIPNYPLIRAGGEFIVEFIPLRDGEYWNDPTIGAPRTGIYTYVDNAVFPNSAAPSITWNQDKVSAYTAPESADTVSLMLNTDVKDMSANSRGFTVSAVTYSVTEATYLPDLIIGSQATYTTESVNFRYPLVLKDGHYLVDLAANDGMWDATHKEIDIQVNMSINKITINDSGVISTVDIKSAPYGRANEAKINIDSGSRDMYLENVTNPLVWGTFTPAYGNNRTSFPLEELSPIILIGDQKVKAEFDHTNYNPNEREYNQENEVITIPGDSFQIQHARSGYDDPGSSPQGTSDLTITMLDYMGNKTEKIIKVVKDTLPPKVQFRDTIIDATSTAMFTTSDPEFHVVGSVYGAQSRYYAEIVDYMKNDPAQYHDLFNNESPWRTSYFDENDLVPSDLIHPIGTTDFDFLAKDLKPGHNLLGITGSSIVPPFNGASEANARVPFGPYIMVLNVDIFRFSSSDATDESLVQTVTNGLSDSMLKGQNESLNQVITNLALPYNDPNYDALIRWSSANSEVITDSGILKRQNTDQTVTMTATITRGQATMTKDFTVKVIAKQVDTTSGVTEDKTFIHWDAIRGANTVQTNVTDSLTLPTSGANGTTITWSSDDAKHISVAKVPVSEDMPISTQARIYKPLFDEADATVNLTAKFTNGSVLEYKNFTLIVKKDTQNANKAKLLRAMDLLTMKQLLGNNSSDMNVTQDLVFPTSIGNDGITISWYSLDQSLISDSGKITKQSFNAYSTVQAILRLGNDGVGKTFGFFVRSADQISDPTYDKLDDTAVQAAQASIVWNLIKQNNVDQKAVNSDLHLPTRGANDTTIAWTSSYPSVISSAGSVRRSSTHDETVTLTATTTKNNATPLTKEFTIVVAKLPASSVGIPGLPTIPTGGKQTVIITEDQLKGGEGGKSTVEVPSDTKEVKLPTSASDLLGLNKLELKSDNLTLDIPSVLLKKLTDSLSADELKDSSISIKFDALTDEKAKELVDNNTSTSNVKLAGLVYEFTLSVISKDGKVVSTLSKFNQPITITFKVNASADTKNVAVYYISEDGTLEYIGGEYKDGEITAQISHFSKYAVLEVTKTFSDVPNTHWASAVIKNLVAKQIVSGATDTTFNPEGNVTRAEFTKLLVQALKLTATGEISFTDVDANAWYANYISIAVKAGIVSGKSDTTFDPNAQITREEMVTMMMRAYAILNTSPQTGDTAVEFTDASEVSSWATEYVNAAAKLQLIQGRAEGKFAPKGMSTRAEAAQVIYNMLKK
jgi:subtilisin family serine protease